MPLRATKTLTIATGAGTATLDTEAATLTERLSPNPTTNFIDIAATTNFTAGTFNAYVEYVENGGFVPAVVQGATGSVINAVDIGAAATVGDVKRWEFKGNPYRVRVVAASVVPAADTVDVVVSQAQGV